MSRYRSYSKGGRFNPVRIPQNEAEKIRQQGLRAMQQSDQNYEFEAKQSRQVARVFDDNKELEIKLENQNANDQQQFADMMHKAKLQNLRVSIDDAQRKSAKGNQTLNNLKAIAAFSQQAGDAYMKVEGLRRKNIDNFLQEATLNYGLTWEVFNSYKKGDSALQASELDRNTLLNKLEFEQNAPKDVVNRIRRGGGYMTYAMNSQQAMRRADSLRVFLAQNSNELIEIDGRKVSLNSAINTSPEILQRVLDKLTSRHFSDKEGNPLFDAKVLGGSGAAKRTQEIHAEWVQRSAAYETKNYWQDRHDNDIVIIKQLTGNKIGSTEVIGAAGLFETAKMLAGDPTKQTKAEYKRNLKAAMKRVSEAATAGVKSGQIPWANVSNITHLKVGPGSGIDVPGLQGGKSVLATKYFPKFANPIIEAAQDAENIAREQAEAAGVAHTLEGWDFNTKLDRYLASGERNNKLLNGMLTFAMQQGRGTGDGNNPWAIAVQKIQQQQAFHNNSINDRAGIANLTRRAERGYIITDKDIEMYNLSYGATIKAKQLRTKYNRLLPSKEGRDVLNDTVEATLNGLIDKKTRWGMSTTYPQALAFAKEEAMSHYMTFLQAKGNDGNHADALKYAADKMITLMNSNAGDWVVKSGANGIKEIAKFQASGVKTIELNRDKIHAILKADPNAIYTEEFFDTETLRSFSGKANRGLFPELLSRAHLIESITNSNILGIDAIQAGLQRLINQEIAETGAATTKLLPDSFVKQYKDISSHIGPAGQDICMSYNQVDINKACMKPREDGTIGQPVYIKPTQDKLEQVEAEGVINGTNNTYTEFLKERYNVFLTNKDGIYNSPFGFRDPAITPRWLVDKWWKEGFYKDLMKLDQPKEEVK